MSYTIHVQIKDGVSFFVDNLPLDAARVLGLSSPRGSRHLTVTPLLPMPLKAQWCLFVCEVQTVIIKWTFEQVPAIVLAEKGELK